MRQSIIAYDGIWWNFFIDRSGALCFRKKTAHRWGQREILLRDIQPDFAVLAHGEQLHLVCQNNAGGIFYLQYNSGGWQKTTVYDGESKAAYPKQFQLTAVGKFLNLFYILQYKERPMLVHQILGMSGANAVDYIQPGVRSFYVLADAGTNLTVFYQNAEGEAGFRRLIWSKKEFSPFTPLRGLEGSAFALCALPAANDSLYLCGVEQLRGKDSIFCAQLSPDGSLFDKQTITLDARADSVPLLLDWCDKLYLLWNEGNHVRYALCADGQNWTAPVRLIKSEYTPAILYDITAAHYQAICYGYEADDVIHLFVLSALLDNPPHNAAPSAAPRLRGQDVEDFAQESVHFRRYKLSAEDTSGGEKPYITAEQLYTELSSLKEAVAGFTQLSTQLQNSIHSLSGMERMLTLQAEAISQLEQRLEQLEQAAAEPPAPLRRPEPDAPQMTEPLEEATKEKI